MPEQIKIRLGGSQLSDLSILRDIGSKQLKTFIKKVKSLSPVPLEIKELSRILDNLFPDAKTDSEAVIRQLMSLYAFRRKRNLSGKEISDAITHGIKSAPKNIRWDIKGINKWKQVENLFVELLSIDNLWSISKAFDLGYEYSNILESARIITDIRPVFDYNVSKIDGSIVTFTLHLSYDNDGTHRTMNLAIDESDLKNLKETCDRALKKSKLANNFMKKKKISSLIMGAEK